MKNPVGTMVWDPITFAWIPQTTTTPEPSAYLGTVAASEDKSDIVGGQGNYAGMAIAALQPVNIAATTKLVNNGNFIDLDVAGDAIFHGKVFFNGPIDTKRYDCSPTSGAVVYLDMKNGTSQYLLLKRNLTVWLPSIDQRESTLSLLVEQDATGGWVITWRINAAADGSAPFPWPTGKAPVMNVAPGAVETFSFSWCKNLNNGQGGYATELWNRLTAAGVLSGNLARAVITADKLYAGTLTAYLVNVVNRLRGCTVKFWEASLNHVSWLAGTLTLAQATYTALSGQDPSEADVTWGTLVSNIGAGAYATALSASNAYYAYITYAVDAYGEPASIGSMTFATSYPTGLYDIVLAIITCDAVGHLAVEVVGTLGTIINGDHIATGTITAAKIAAGTITATQIATGTITADKLSASYIVVAGAAADINAGSTTISGGKITASSIAADRLSVSFIQVGGGAADINAGATTISGAKITTGTIDAAAINAGTLTGMVIQTAASGSRMVVDSYLHWIHWYDADNVQVGALAILAGALICASPTGVGIASPYLLLGSPPAEIDFGGIQLKRTGNDLYWGATKLN